MGLLDGQVALVTGGGSGIGRAVVDLYLKEGAKVGILERVKDRVDTLNREIGSAGKAFSGDVTKMEDNERAVAETVGAFGKLDIFVGNAGVFDNFIPLADLDKGKIAQAASELFAVNVTGYILGAKAALPELQKTSGCIVFTASFAGFNPGGGGVIYTASKHAVFGIIRQLAHELAPNIRVNGVAPGGVKTDLRGLATLGTDQSSNFEQVPEGVLQKPSEQAGAYLFLACPELSNVTSGAVIDTTFMRTRPTGQPVR